MPTKRKLTVLLAVNIAVILFLESCRAIPYVHASLVELLLVILVLVISMRLGRAEAVSASITAALGFDYHFVEPIGHIDIRDTEGWTAVLGLLAAAVVSSHLSQCARRTAKEAQARQREAERLFELGRSLMFAGRMDTLAQTAAEQMVPIFGCEGATFFLLDKAVAHSAGSISVNGAALLGCAEKLAPSRDGTSWVLPVACGTAPFGSIALAGVELSETAMRSITGLLSTTVERLVMSESLARANEALEGEHKELLQQKRLSETLLLNILPEEVAEELRTNGAVAPKYFEDVTIIFTDFVGFTTSTEKLAAEDLVRLLHDYFTAFDRICARYGVEKLKTIGDAYLCIAGLPVRSPSHPVDAVMAAFEMVEEVRSRREQGMAPWKVRIGIHTGPVVAGVVGIDKFAFDIWGDTVNFSARMESSGAPDRINLSERTWARVKDFFACDYRGKIATKEKREVDMFFAEGLLPALQDGWGEGPPAPFARRYEIYFQKAPLAFPAFLREKEAILVQSQE